MKKLFAPGFLLVSFLTFAISGLAGAAEKTGPSADEAAILKMERDWPALAMKADTAAMLAMGSPDCVFVDPSGGITTLQQIAADMKSGAMKVEAMTIDDLQVKMHGDAAIVLGLETEKSQYKGKDTSGQYRFADTWVKKHGHWLCVASANTKVVPDKE